MASIGDWLRRVHHLLRRRQMEEDLRREMDAHRAMMGEPRRFGNTLRLREEARDAWGWHWLDDTTRNVRHALRQLRQGPAFAVAAILTLAIGIGANAAVFSVVNALLIRPLPYQDPDRLLAVAQTTPAGLATVSPADFQDWRALIRSLSIAAYGDWQGTLTGVGDPEQLSGGSASTGLFEVLGVTPVLGRTLQDGDERRDGPVTVISHALWQRRFGGDPAIVGRSIRLNDRPHVVIGVMPAAFAFPSRNTELWVPLALDPSRRDRGEHSLSVIARLATGVAPEQAQAELTAVSASLERQFPRTNAGTGAVAVPLRSWWVGARATKSLWILLGAVNLLLLMTCVNVANLLLARVSTREREMALRSALGASRWKLAWQLFSEATVLAGIGASVGLAVAFVTRDAMLQLLPGYLLSPVSSVAIDGRVVAYVVLVCLATSVVFAMVPMLTLWRTTPATFPAVGHTPRPRWNRGLLAGEAFVTVVLLVGAALLIRSWLQVSAIPAGFDPAGVVTARISLPAPLYSEPAQVLDFYDRLIAAIAAAPAVDAAGLVTNVPLAGTTSQSNVTVERPAATPREQAVADRLIVTPGYFQALRIQTIAGRSFTERDVTGASRVAIVNEAFARQHWPGMDPIGRRFRRGIASSTLPWMTVVGVVADVKHDALEAGVRPTFYLSFAQDPTHAMTLLIRSGGEPAPVIRTVQQAVRALDPDQPVAAVRTLDAIHVASLGHRRLPAAWFGVFAALACLLAATGVYALVAYSVAARTREFGVRIAIGCTPAGLLREVVWDGIRPVLLGTASGAIVAAASADVLSGLLFQVQARDTTSFLAAVTLPLVAALLASYVPARGVTRIAPVEALRHE